MSHKPLAEKGHKSRSRNKPDRDGKHIELRAHSSNMEGYIVTLWPSPEFSRAYAHEGEEIRLVLEGELEVDVGGRRYYLKKGDVLWHSSSVPHCLRNPGRRKARYFVVATPPTLV
ncbi:MAG: cupin domain-containing protein [Thermoplasmatota archaeon]